MIVRTQVAEGPADVPGPIEPVLRRERTERAAFAPRTVWFLHGAALAVICAYLSPLYLQGESAHIRIFDHLDSWFADLKILAESGRIFALPNATIPNLATGMPRGSFVSPLYVPVWLNYSFGPLAGLIINQTLLRLAAYCGMYLLLDRWVLGREHGRVPSMLAALAFAILPHHEMAGLSVAGQPLFVHLLLSVRAGTATWREWSCLGVMPCYMLATHGSAYLLAACGLLTFVDVIRAHPRRWMSVAAFAVACLATVIVEHQLLLSLLSPAMGFVSHRTEFSFEVSRNIVHALANFTYGEEFTQTLQNEYVLPVFYIAMLILLVQGARAAFPTRVAAGALLAMTAVVLTAWLGVWLYFFQRFTPLTLFRIPAVKAEFEVLRPYAGEYMAAGAALLLLLAAASRLLPPASRRHLRWLLGLVAAIALISLNYAYSYDLLRVVKALVPELPYANLSRFTALYPLLWYLLFGLSLAVLWHRTGRVGPAVATAVGVLQIVFLFGHSEERVDRLAGLPTYGQFYSPALFDEIDAYIGRPKVSYRVISLGMHPSIAAYNGFHAVDGYHQNYPLAHKHRFRELIAGELQKNEFYRGYFDSFGGRYYLFASELRDIGTDEFLLTKEKVIRFNARVKQLAFDTDAFRRLGGRYLFSTVEIGNAAEIGLVMRRTFEREGSPWRLLLYEVAEPS